MRYSVFNTVTQEYVWDDRLILKPDGRVAMNDYGDEVGLSDCIPIFFHDDSDRFYNPSAKQAFEEFDKSIAPFWNRR